jgi:hypothetical protein
MEISYVSLEVNTPEINVGMGHHLKYGEGKEVLGKQVLKQTGEESRNPTFPFFL